MRPTSLRDFGAKTLVVTLLHRAAAGELLGREVRDQVECFRGLMIVRPDGIIAEALTGRAVERAGELRKDGEEWRAGELVVGALYRDEGGLALSDRGAAPGRSDPWPSVRAIVGPNGPG